jgi:hypothetical protein
MALGGDADNDDAGGEALWAAADDGTWKPDCWSKHPDQLTAEAKATNFACAAHVAANAGKHSNPSHNPVLRSV